MRPFKIHIAEADQRLRDELQRVLSQHGFQVTVSASGYPIAEMMDNWPDLFLLDIELPDVNGIELCKWLKVHPDSQHIPVILLGDDLYLKVLAASSPADMYMRKPIDIADLLDKVNYGLQLSGDHHAASTNASL